MHPAPANAATPSAPAWKKRCATCAGRTVAITISSVSRRAGHPERIYRRDDLVVDGAAAICGEARHVALRRETELEVAVDALGLATEELIFGLVCYGRPMSLELTGEERTDLSAWQRARPALAAVRR